MNICIHSRITFVRGEYRKNAVLTSSTAIAGIHVLIETIVECIFIFICVKINGIVRI